MDDEIGEGVRVYNFPDRARKGFTPFEDGKDWKFVRISPEVLEKWARDKKVELGEDEKEKGIVLFGHLNLGHKRILMENLGLTEEESLEFPCADGGFLANHFEDVVVIAGFSGELKNEKGKDFIFIKDEGEIARIHQETSEVLKKIYEGGEKNWEFEVLEAS